MSVNSIKLWLLVFLSSSCFLLAEEPAELDYRVVVDASNRQIKLPPLLKRVYGASPPVTNILLTIAPEAVMGLNFAIREDEKRYLPIFVQELPVLGGWFGQGNTPNFEALLARNPEVVVNWRREESFIEDKFAVFNIPVFHVNLDGLHDYPQAWLDLGRLFQKPERAEQLSVAAASYLSKAISIAKQFKNSPSVYYAEGRDGLQTECPDSVHVQAVALMGGQLVHQCESTTHAGLVTVSKEKILLYNPDIILVHQLDFYQELSENIIWQDLSAVRNKRFYLIPSSPFNWLDRPPSFMRLLGALWLGYVFYHQPNEKELREEIDNFYRLFLNWELTSAEMADILKHSL